MILPSHLQLALESDCAVDLSEIIQARRKEDFEDLLGLLSTSPEVDPGHRLRAIYALGRWGDEQAVDDILQVMPVLDEPGQIAAIEALGLLGSAEALQTILDHSADPSPHVRKFVIHTLGRFTLPEARAKLIEMSEKDADPKLRKLAKEYAGKGQ